MTDKDIKRSLVAQKGHFTGVSKLFDQQLKAFCEDKNEYNLKNLQYLLEQLQKQFEKVPEKGQMLAESKDEDTRKAGEKEVEEITEKFGVAQGKFSEHTKTPKTERKAGMYSRMGGMGAFLGGGTGRAFKSGKMSDDEGAEDAPTTFFPRDKGKKGRKDDQIPTWRPKVTFEAWQSNLKHWMEEVQYSEHQYLIRLFSMLQGKKGTEEVREFTIKLGERRTKSRDTVEKILVALQEKFGETEEEQYRRKVENFRKFSYKGKAEEALENVDDI